MPDVLIRNLDKKTVKRLKERAKIHHRSLQAELKALIEANAPLLTNEEFAERCRQFQKDLKGRILGDSADLIREDRDSR